MLYGTGMRVSNLLYVEQTDLFRLKEANFRELTIAAVKTRQPIALKFVIRPVVQKLLKSTELQEAINNKHRGVENGR